MTETCEVCNKAEIYHKCETCEKGVCISCFNSRHFGIGQPRSGKSIVYNKCVFCNAIFGANAKCAVCDDCQIVLTWKTSMNYLAAINRISKLVGEGKLESKLRNEEYCMKNFGTRATQVIMDALDSVARERK